MLPTASLCRAQQVYHQERAALATLENVRRVSTKAALAWGQEAAMADRRESRLERRRAIADAVALEARPAPATDFEDLWLSENPDRGLALP